MKSTPLLPSRGLRKDRPLTARFAWRFLGLSAAILAAQAPRTSLAQTAYTWTSSTTGGAWTSNTNWTPTGVPGGNAGDTAGLTNATANRDITLNANETIAGLTYAETSGFVNELEIDSTAGTTITLTNTTTLALGGSGVTGTELLYLNATSSTALSNVSYAGAINIGSHGVLEMGSYNNGNPVSSVTGAVTVNSGGSINVDQSIFGAGTPTITGNLTVNSGATVTINSTNPAAAGTASSPDTRFTFSGSSLVVGGTIANMNTTSLVSGGTAAAPAAELYISGTTASSAQFTSTAVLTNLGTQGSGGIFYSGTRLGTSPSSPGFTLTSDAAQLPIISLAPGNTTGTDYIDIGPVTAGGTFVATALAYTNAATAATTEISLTGNVTLNGQFNSTTNIRPIFAINNTHPGSIILNLAGNTLDTSATTAGFSTSGLYSYSIIGGGTFKAALLNLGSNTGATGASVGPNTILQATGGNATVNNLGNATAGTIDPTSTFYYTGAAAAGTPATLTSNHTIGALTVGTGTSASNLQLATAGLSVASNVTVAAGASLQLGGQILTMTSGANLTGTGTIAGTTANVIPSGASPNAVTFTGTGGIVPGTNGTVGALTLTGTQTLTLASGSTSYFDIVGMTTAGNDHVTLTPGTGTITVNYAGTLALNFNGITPTNGETFQIVDNDATATGNFGSITSNIAGDSFSFVDTTGILTVMTAVPEPGTGVQAGVALLLVIGAGAFRRIKRREASAV